MHPTHVTVAIDIDGVLAPLVDWERDPKLHEIATGWPFRSLQEVMLRTVVAEPVVQTLLELDAPGACSAADAPSVRVLWHSSWWLQAAEELAPALGLAHLTGGLETMFATEDEYLGRSTGAWADDSWWKLRAVQRWLRDHPVDADGSHELLIWIDDDIAYSLEKGEISEGLTSDPRLVMVSPNTRTGIEPGELALLRALTRLD